MKITGPQPIVVAPPVSSTDVRITIDLDAGLLTVTYGPIAGLQKSASAPLAPAVLTALKNHVMRTIETNEGWTNGSGSLA